MTSWSFPDQAAYENEREMVDAIVRQEAARRVIVEGCDRCGALAELFHNEATGLALCEDCDGAADEAATEVVPVTWKRLRNGAWGVTGPSALLVPDAPVVVTKRNGETKTVTVGRVLWSGDGTAIATVRK